MSGNGKRPRIEISAPNASEEEAAAIAAAIERRLGESAAPLAGEPQIGGWQRAALLEGVDHAPARVPWMLERQGLADAPPVE
ncbi:MAG: hypothetical protein EXQ70_01875 [Solirubrobacterales bacterium]|nr:hypothetical protein [Solirubrobacterales bacterium]